MIKTLIIEDEAVAARNLKRMLSLLPQQFEVVAILDSVANILTTLPNLDIDLIFMDIHLSDGNAFQIFEHIQISTPIIFTTAYNQYMQKAFKQHSIDYLLKPIHQKDLEVAVQKFDTYFNPQKESPALDYQAIANLLSGNKKYKKRFLVQIGKKLKTIEVADIAYFFVQNKTTYFCTSEKRTYPIDFSLSQLEEQLDPEQYFRVNRQHLISSKAIVEIYYLFTTRLKVTLQPQTDEDILVTIDKIGKFKHWLNQ